MAFLAFYRQKSVASNLMDNAKCTYYQDKLHEHKRTTKESSTYEVVY